MAVWLTGPDKTARLFEDMRARHRADALAADPSSIQGMTQAELDNVIDTGSIPTTLLNDVLNQP